MNTQDHVDEFAGMWWDDHTVLVLAFTDHVEEHRAAIDRLWPPAFRVIEARYTEQELARAQVAINADEDLRGRLPGRVLYANSLDVPGQVVEVAVAVDDRVTRDAIGQRYDLAILNLQPRFHVVEGDGPKLTTATQVQGLLADRSAWVIRVPGLLTGLLVAGEVDEVLQRAAEP
ncbi:MAG: hypothetical protein KY462_16020 [Actinobacteria bacterium]|nr:hypothetical protein [Actinomycetota bacterium]